MKFWITKSSTFLLGLIVSGLSLWQLQSVQAGFDDVSTTYNRGMNQFQRINALDQFALKNNEGIQRVETFVRGELSTRVQKSEQSLDSLKNVEMADLRKQVMKLEERVRVLEGQSSSGGKADQGAGKASKEQMDEMNEKINKLSQSNTILENAILEMAKRQVVAPAATPR